VRVQLSSLKISTGGAARSIDASVGGRLNRAVHYRTVTVSRQPGRPCSARTIRSHRPQVFVCAMRRVKHVYIACPHYANCKACHCNTDSVCHTPVWYKMRLTCHRNSFTISWHQALEGREEPTIIHSRFLTAKRRHYEITTYQLSRHIRHWISRKALEIEYRLCSKGPLIGTGLWGIEWSRDRLRHMILKVKLVTAYV